MVRSLLARGLLALVPGLPLAPVAAAERPFLAAESAAAEEDDDRVWSAQAGWFQPKAGGRGPSFALEYAFDPTNAVQLEFARLRDRAGGVRADSVELEYRFLFNHIARDGWGVGLVAAVEADRQTVGGGREGWRSQGVSLNLPFTLQLGNEGALLHVTLGLARERGGERERLRAAAVELPLAARVTGFLELAREGRQSLAHAGARWWVRREKIALDFGLFRTREEGERGRGFMFGVGWFDL